MFSYCCTYVAMSVCTAAIQQYVMIRTAAAVPGIPHLLGTYHTRGIHMYIPATRMPVEYVPAPIRLLAFCSTPNVITRVFPASCCTSIQSQQLLRLNLL